MGWRNINPQDIVSRMTIAEQAVITATSGATSKLQTRLTDAVLTFDSALTATGHRVGPVPQVPDSLRNHIMAYAVYQWLSDTPLSSSATKAFLTEARQKNYDASVKMLADISMKRAGAIEDIFPYPTTGNWNSSNRVIMRMDGGPGPNQQFSALGANGPLQANPGATTYTPLDTVPDAPKNLLVFQSNLVAGQLILCWDFPSNAITFNIFRGSTSGAENTTPIATLVYFNTWTDATCVVGQEYFYQVQSVNEIGNSVLTSNEAYNTSIPTLAPNPPGGFVFV